jgi:hypothetical protein
MPFAPPPACVACVACGAPATRVHVREATARELASWASDPLVPSVTPLDLEPSAAPTLVPAHSCDACAPPPERAALVHSPTCAPPWPDSSCRACAMDLAGLDAPLADLAAPREAPDAP